MSEKEIKIIKTPSTMPFYITGTAWVILSFILPMYALSSLFINAAVSAIVFIVCLKVFPSKEERIEIIKEKEYASLAVKEAVEEGQRMMDELQQADLEIEDETLSRQIQQIIMSCHDILNAIQKRPDRVGTIRKFLNYYLPTTLKLLNHYAELEKQTVQLENVKDSKMKIEKMITSIVEACKRQLDHIFETESMDISAEITVMESMMSQEGLLNKKPFKEGQQ